MHILTTHMEIIAQAMWITFLNTLDNVFVNVLDMIMALSQT